MANIREIIDVYETVESTWGKIRADAISHVVVLTGMFLVVGVTVPELKVPQFDLAKVLESNYYKLAKDTGILLLTSVIALVPLLGYILLLRFLGRIFVILWLSLFQPVSKHWLASASITWHLANVALVLQKERFTLEDIVELAQGKLLFLYRDKRKADYEAYQQSAQSLSRNATIYLGNASVFLAVWVLLFITLPNGVSWKRMNQEHFWPAVLFLSAFVLWGWIRTRRLFSFLPVLQVRFVSTMIRSDPDQKRPDDAGLGEAIIRIEALQRRLSRPSLLEYILFKAGYRKLPPEAEAKEREMAFGPWESKEERQARLRWIPLSDIYEEGREFAERPDQHRNYKDWLGGYTSYIYYTLIEGLRRRLRALWQLLLFLIRG